MDSQAVYVLQIDFLQLIAFFGFLALLCEAVRRFGVPPSEQLTRVIGLGAWLAVLAAVADLIEDACWIKMIRYGVYHPYASVAAWATRAEFLFLAFVLACIVLPGAAKPMRALGVGSAS